MGMDYRYLLFFEREARFDVLEHLAEMATPGSDGPTTLVLPDRTVTLPFAGWLKTGARLSWDDPSPTWDFMTVLSFEPDESIEDYLNRTRARYGEERTDAEPDLHDAQGRATIGIIYLSVHQDMAEWPSETGEDLVLFEFGTPGSTMSVLFTESESIRRTFIHLLEACRGVYGLLDMEDPADLFWLRGEERTERLPTAELPLAEIERLAGDTGTSPPAFTFAADEVLAAVRHVRRAVGGVDLGTHHWLVALLETGRSMPEVVGPADPTVAAQDLRRRLDGGDIGEPLSEDELRRRATELARGEGEELVTVDHVVRVVADAAASPT